MPRKRKTNVCPVDEKRFNEILKEKGLRIRAMSEEIGREGGYLTNRITRSGSFPTAIAITLEAKYQIAPEDYAPIKEELKPEESEGQVPSAPNVDLSETNASLKAINDTIDSTAEKCMTALMNESDSYVKKSDIQALTDAVNHQTEVFEKLCKTVNVTCTILQNDSDVRSQDSQSIIDLLSVISTKLSNF